jgi:CheY-like chemotaxis protein
VIRERTVELEHRTAQLTQLASDLTLAERHAREQLAKILHDGLQQVLAAAAIHVEQQMNLDSKRGVSTSLLVQAKRELDEAIAAARSLSVELCPPLLQSAGLSAALIWLADWTRHKYGLEVDVSVNPSADSTQKDVRTLLFESARELLFNAVKHAHVDRVRLDLALDADGMICITVADQGVGFDVAGLVEQAKSSHVGWGLFSIRERLTLLGGRFVIESAPGRGTTFRLIAPRRTTQRRARPTFPESPADVGATPRETVSVASARPLRILIVDDHQTVRSALCELLQERPELQVVGEAANGLEAIAQADALLPDVVLMDVSMPEMDGVEATRRIRGSFPLVQVLGLSVSSRTKEPHPIELAGAECFFAKGDDAQSLIDHLLNKYRAITSDHPVN